MSLKPLRTEQPAVYGGAPLDGEFYRWLSSLLEEVVGKPRIRFVTETLNAADLTDGGGAVGTKTLAARVPAGARYLYTTCVNLVGFTGDVSAVIQLGDGTDVDRYNTGTPSLFTTATYGVDMGVPSGTAWHSAAKTIVATVTSNANITPVLTSGGSVELQFCFLEAA